MKEESFWVPARSRVCYWFTWMNRERSATQRDETPGLRRQPKIELKSRATASACKYDVLNYGEPVVPKGSLQRSQPPSSPPEPALPLWARDQVDYINLENELPTPQISTYRHATFCSIANTLNINNN